MAEEEKEVQEQENTQEEEKENLPDEKTLINRVIETVKEKLAPKEAVQEAEDELDLDDEFDLEEEDEVVEPAEGASEEDKLNQVKVRAERAEAELRKIRTKEAVDRAIKKYPNADREYLEGLRKKGRPEQQIFKEAKLMEVTARRILANQKPAQNTEETGANEEKLTQEITKVAEEIVKGWGKPNTGDASTGGVTWKDIKDKPFEEKIKHGAQLQKQSRNFPKR